MDKRFRMELRSAFKRKSRIQNLKWAGLFAIVVALTVCGARAEAQQAKKIRLIGYLSPTDPATESTRSGAFRQGLRDLGYVEGKNFVIAYRYLEGKLDQAPGLVAELVQLNVDVLVVQVLPGIRAAKQATKTIPIVMTQDPDPIGNGFVASLARPGGNITGLSNLNLELSGKRLELLKEIVPTLSRVAVLGTSTQPGHAQALTETELAAGALGVELQYLRRSSSSSSI